MSSDDLLALDDDPDLAPGLQGEGLGDALERRGDLFELLQPLDVGLEELPPGARPRGRERVGGLDEDGLDRREIDVPVVRGDGLADLLRLPVFLGQLDAELGVRPFRIPVDGLADVVEEARPQGDVRVEADLPGHHGREHGHFLRVLEDVLAVARPVPELAQELDELGMDVPDLELEDGRFALLFDLHLEVGLDRLDDVLDPGRVDPAVGDELLDGQAGELPADGVEARQDDRLRACRRR